MNSTTTAKQLDTKTDSDEAIAVYVRVTYAVAVSPGPNPFPMSSVSEKIAKAVPLISGMQTFYSTSNG